MSRLMGPILFLFVSILVGNHALALTCASFADYAENVLARPLGPSSVRDWTNGGRKVYLVQILSVTNGSSQLPGLFCLDQIFAGSNPSLEPGYFVRTGTVYQNGIFANGYQETRTYSLPANPFATPTPLPPTPTPTPRSPCETIPKYTVMLAEAMRMVSTRAWETFPISDTRTMKTCGYFAVSTATGDKPSDPEEREIDTFADDPEFIFGGMTYLGSPGSSSWWHRVSSGKYAGMYESNNDDYKAGGIYAGYKQYLAFKRVSGDVLIYAEIMIVPGDPLEYWRVGIVDTRKVE